MLVAGTPETAGSACSHILWRRVDGVEADISLATTGDYVTPSPGNLQAPEIGLPAAPTCARSGRPPYLGECAVHGYCPDKWRAPHQGSAGPTGRDNST